MLCRHCGNDVRLRPKKPGFIDECDECLARMRELGRPNLRLGGSIDVPLLMAGQAEDESGSVFSIEQADLYAARHVMFNDVLTPEDREDWQEDASLATFVGTRG